MVFEWKKIRMRCGFHNGFEVSVDGTPGGLSLGWNGG